MILILICVCFILIKTFEQIFIIEENELQIRTIVENDPYIMGIFISKFNFVKIAKTEILYSPPFL